MNTKLSSRFKFLASLIILLLLILVFSSDAVHSSPLLSEELRRADMIEIAERYASHAWEATQDNILHGEIDIGGHPWQVDTPDLGGITGGWWIIGPGNIGVPYQWGGWSALGDADLNLVTDRPDGRYFDGENGQLENGYAAGDIFTNSAKREYGQAAGVDCSGLVSRAWRTNGKLGSSLLKDRSRR